jgi:hypothetical protein
MSRSLSVFTLILVLPAFLRADDLDNILARDQQVKAQKLITQVSDALAKADAFKNSDPVRAVDGLQKVLGLLRDDTTLSPDSRTMYLQRVQSRLRTLEEVARVRRQAEEEIRLREEEKILREKRLNDQAQKDKSPAATAGNRIRSTADQLAALDRLRGEKNQRMNSIFRQIQESAVPIEGAVEFPKYWAALTETRKKSVGNQLTEKEVNLLRSLNSTMAADFNMTKFRDVLDLIMEKTGQAIIVDEGSLREAMVEYDDPITFKVPKVTVRTILKKVLADKGLTYILKEGTIQVMTPQKARETMVVRTYPIDDLVGGTDPMYGPFLGRAVMYQNVQNLINTIQRAIEPGLWDVNGGPGSITFFEAGRALVVRAPAELHYMMGAGGLMR